MPLFTVILPVYNVKDHLERCVRSILSQSVTDWEMLLVDDGSTDGSGVLCDRWAQGDPRIRVIHQENGGLASARNTGLDAAAGDYVLMFDSDDYVEPNTLEVVRRAVEDHQPDVVRFDLSVVSSGHVSPRITAVPAGLYADADVQQKLLRHALLYHEEYVMSSCIHAYRLAFLNRHHLRFVSEREVLSEDFLFIICVLLCAGRVFLTNQPLYFYDMREGSLTHGPKPRMFERYASLYSHAVAFAQERQATQEIIRWINTFFVYALVYSCCFYREYLVTPDHSLAQGRQNVRSMLRSPVLMRSVKDAEIRHMSPKDKLRVLFIRLRCETALCFTFRQLKRGG